MTTRILVVDETPVLGEAIAHSLRGQRDLDVRAVVSSLAQAQRYLDQIDVIVLSESLSNSDTQNLLDLAGEQDPEITVILVGYGEEADPQHLASEFSDYWDKGNPAAGLIKSIQVASPPPPEDRGSTGQLRENVARMEKVREALHQAALVSRDLTTQLEKQMSKAGEHTRDSRLRRMSITELTDRQQEVLGLIAKGHTNAEIAQHLHITEGTAKNHVHNILSRFGVDSREEAVLIFRGQKRRQG